LGWVTADAVTTLGSGVDGSVGHLETAFDTGGRPYLYTSYDAATGGNVVNQVQQVYNGLGQLTKEYQSHSGVVTGPLRPRSGPKVDRYQQDNPRKRRRLPPRISTIGTANF
jgi:hypothetical protein